MIKKPKISIEKLYPLLIFNFVTEELPTNSTYEDRLMWQKVGYLAQQFGASLSDFSFTWYKAGPYSPAYTSVLYSLPDNLDDMYNYRLDESVIEKIEPLKEIYESAPHDISVVKWLELVASLLYIVKEMGLDKDSSIKTLKRRKPFFNNTFHNNTAWGLLENLGMI
ncbi:hypothetical protein [Lysinibacillus capsici]|uniref:hypothetical protein n=1 Tax=Lysinibacillus capsici TaxID=2115968 RepID=UPI0028A5FAA0|nr:hypothetical protein [Lysinibacillus capsici]